MNTLDELILKWQDARITPDELRQLNNWLSSPENRQRLHEEFVLTATLHQTLCAGRDPKQIIPFAPGVAPPVRTNRWIWAAAACAAILITLLATSFRPTPTAVVRSLSGDPEIESNGAFFAVGLQTKAASGDYVRTGEDASASIEFSDGTTILLNENSIIEPLGLGRKKLLILHSGSMTARVAPQPRPLIVKTAHAEAEVLGTEFSLSALPHSTRIEVIEGKVRFKRIVDGKEVKVQTHQFATACPKTELAVREVLPEPWGARDIGAVQLHGSAFMSAGICRVKGSGRNTCQQKDQLHFLYQNVSGDFDFRARLIKIAGSSPDSRAGLMVRRSLQSACQQLFLAVRGDGTLEFQHRPEQDNESEVLKPEDLPVWLRVSRSEHELVVYISKSGDEWEELRRDRIDCGQSPFVGLAVTSFNNEILEESLFDNISLKNNL